MPRYYFQIGDEPRDEQGRDIGSLGEAKCEAVKYLGELICDSANRFWDRADFRLEVTDEQGLVLFTLHLIGTEAPAIVSTR